MLSHLDDAAVVGRKVYVSCLNGFQAFALFVWLQVVLL